MRRELLTGRPGQALAMALMVLSVGVGFCLLDGHDHDGTHRVAFDLCLGMALVWVAAVGFTSILIHAMPLLQPLAVHAPSPHAPDPPPKLSARS